MSQRNVLFGIVAASAVALVAVHAHADGGSGKLRIAVDAAAGSVSIHQEELGDGSVHTAARLGLPGQTLAFVFNASAADPRTAQAYALAALLGLAQGLAPAEVQRLLGPGFQLQLLDSGDAGAVPTPAGSDAVQALATLIGGALLQGSDGGGTVTPFADALARLGIQPNLGWATAADGGLPDDGGFVGDGGIFTDAGVPDDGGSTADAGCIWMCVPQ